MATLSPPLDTAFLSAHPDTALELAAVPLFQRIMEGTEDLPPKIKMEHAGNAWRLALMAAAQYRPN